MEKETKKKVKRKISKKALVTIIILLVILLGSLLLYLPLSSAGDSPCSYLDALFTSTSAVCVTGLVVHNTGTYWSTFGHGVLAVLIQIGGLGVITVAITFSLLSGKKIGLRTRDLMQNAIGAPQLGGIIRFTRFLLLFTLLAESAGAFLLAPGFIRRYGVGNGIAKSFFHSISAFCNAGFDTLDKNGTFASPAHALASKVLPVPGGPTKRTPFGSLAPILTYLSGLCKKSTTSLMDSMASSTPCTSWKVTPVDFST